MPSPRRLLACILLSGLALRLYVALTAPWYWDEGYVAELCRSLLHGGRPQIGALWQDGFFPLSTSAIAPYSATPFAALPGLGVMTGLRLWALLWEGLCMLLLYGLGQRLGSRALGLLAAGAYALLPFAVQHGGRAFYHHPGVAFMLLGVWLGQRALEDGERRTVAWAGLAQGLAVAICYWLWWLPLSWGLLLLRRQPRRALLGLACAAPAPLLVLALNVAPDPAAALWSMRCLLVASRAGGPQSLFALLTGLGSSLLWLSFLPLGLAGLAWAAWREPRRWAWPGLVLALAVLEPVRQRGDIKAIAYPFQMAAPFAALGLALLVWGLWQRPQRWTRGLALAAALLWLRPSVASNMLAWSAAPARVAELQAFFEGRPDGGLVCGLPSFNWALLPGHPVCDPNDIGLSEGRQTGGYLAGAPASRLAQPCGLQDIRYAVLSREHFLGLFHVPGWAQSFGRMQREGWPLVFQSPAFRVYENPRFGVRPDPKVDILLTDENRALAGL